jgi:fructosamine-3-kinase
VSLAYAVGVAAGSPVASISRVAGGSINEAYAVALEDGRRAFVKTRAGAPEDEYAGEAASLAWLAEAGAVQVPAVVAVGGSFLALEWIETGALSSDGEEELGRDLAALHAAGAPAFGADRPLRIGELAFDASASDDWSSFYADRLVRPLVAPARDRGALSRGGGEAVERVCDRMADLAGPGEPPARLHGDLWTGNVLGGEDGRAWLIDPVAYGGHREVDLAMLRLFGSPSRRFRAAYEESAPLAAGHEERVPLYQLFPLMVHTVLFGGGYGGSAEQAARRFAG